MTKGLPPMGPDAYQSRWLRSMAHGTLGGSMLSPRPVKPRKFNGVVDIIPDPPVIVEYDGANLVASEGAEPTSWPDTSGNGYDLLPNGVGSEYDYEADCINGQPGIRHVSGSRDYSLELYPASRTDTDFTSMLVAEIPSGTLYTQFILSAATAPDEFMSLQARAADAIAYTSGDNYNTEATAQDFATYTGPHLFVAVRNAAGLSLRVDGVEVATDAQVMDPSEWDYIQIGTRNGGAVAFAKAWAGELVDLAGTEADLMTRFGL